MGHYKYQIFIPGGNKTALVLGIDEVEDDIYIRKNIQDTIFKKHENDTDGEVEQVGFISVGNSAPRLIMTGGEFCGNATRSAAMYYYLARELKEVEITVSGTSKPLQAGVNSSYEAWAQMPIFEDLYSAITPVKDGLYWVAIEGISHLVVSQVQSAYYLDKIFKCDNKDEQINTALAFLGKTIGENSLLLGKACGVIFLENIADVLKMHPFVHVGTADTAYYETGCGSGAICVGLVSSMLHNDSINISLLQPSGKIIKAKVEHHESGKVEGKISGSIEIGKIYEMEC
jgi:diaminopimelate epimerase